MNFNKIKKPLLENILDVVEVHHLLKSAVGAKFLDILFYDKKQDIFFDKINKITINAKFLDDKSVIGYMFQKRKPYYSANIVSEKYYDLPLDNPFKLEILEQMIIPIFEDKKPKGILRFSMLPLGFSSEDYRSFLKLMPIFRQIFSADFYDLNEETVLNNDKQSMELTIEKMKSLFDVLEGFSLNPETFKMIEYGQKNIASILHYLTLEESVDASKDFSKLNMGTQLDKKLNVNVLIADDVHINIKILNAMLSNETSIDQIKYAHDGIETIEVIKNCRDNQESIHILFLDHHMPGMLGSQIAELLKTKEEFKAEVIIVSITNDIEAIKNQNHYYDYHIPKPFSKANVQKIMSEIKINHLENKNK